MTNINKNICFLEGTGIDYTLVNDDFISGEDANYNTFTSNENVTRVSISLFPGFNSTRNNNQILNSNFYDTDTFIKDLDPSSKKRIYFNSVIASEKEIFIADINNESFYVVLKPNVSDGYSIDGNIVSVGLLNVSLSNYSQRINAAFNAKINSLNNDGINFKVRIEYNHEENYIDFSQRNLTNTINFKLLLPDDIDLVEIVDREQHLNKSDFLSYNTTRVIEKNCNVNPRIFNRTLGINNLDYEENIYFNDSMTIFDNDFHFQKPDFYDYIYSFNSIEINSLSTSISVLDEINILQGKITTEQSLLGIKGNISNYSTDSRNRTNNLTYSSKLIDQNGSLLNTSNDINHKYEVEPFLDEGLEDITTVYSDTIYAPYEYDSEGNRSSVTQGKKLTILSNNVLVYSEDKHDIVPYYDNNTVYKNTLKNEGDEITYEVEYYKSYNTLGYDIDKFENYSTDSLTYIGELN